MASPHGPAFDRLPVETQKKIARQLEIRKDNYLLALSRAYSCDVKVVILGDKPGPGRPTDPGWHHTPFYSTRQSSLWLNRLLVDCGIDEHDLLWFNVEHANGKPLDPIHLRDLERFRPTFICLGGQAEMWMRRNAPTSRYEKVFHPQFVRRFKSREPYELIDLIKKAVHDKRPSISSASVNNSAHGTISDVPGLDHPIKS